MFHEFAGRSTTKRELRPAKRALVPTKNSEGAEKPRVGMVNVEDSLAKWTGFELTGAPV